MAGYIQQPTLPDLQPPSGTRVPWAVLMHWLIEVLKFIVLIIFPFKNLDAKAAVLIGNDAKRTMGGGWLPPWAGLIESAFTQVFDEHMDEGVLARNERDFESQQKEWVPIFRMLKAFLSAFQKDFGGGMDAVSWVYRKGQYFSGSLIDAQDIYRRKVLDDEVILDTPSPDVVHLLGLIGAMMTVAARIPYPSLNVETIDKGQTSDEPPIRTVGTLADVIAQKVLEFLTRTDHIVSVRGAKPTEGG